LLLLDPNVDPNAGITDSLTTYAWLVIGPLLQQRLQQSLLYL